MTSATTAVPDSQERRRFACLLVDPPWPGQSGEKHYQTMSLERIRAFPLADLAADDAHVWYWTTNRYLGEAYRILESQGFTVRSPLHWIKFRLGLGGPYSLRNASETCLFATKGKLAVRFRSQPTWTALPVTTHSEKPLELYQSIARISPGPRLECFARRKMPGWSVWGNEVESDITVPGYPVPSDFTEPRGPVARHRAEPTTDGEPIS